MNILITIIVGGLVGWLASLLMKTNAQMGILANVIVGVIGSALGSWLAGQLGMAAGGGIMRWVVAVAGAALLVGILKLLNVFK